MSEAIRKEVIGQMSEGKRARRQRPEATGPRDNSSHANRPMAGGQGPGTRARGQRPKTTGGPRATGHGPRATGHGPRATVHGPLAAPVGHLPLGRTGYR